MDANRWSNILRLEQGYAGGQAQLAAGPLEAYIEVAARCNLRCEMCPIIVDPRYQPGSGRPGFLAPELFDRLESVFPTLTRVYLFGLGEPVLHPDLVKFTERLASAGVEVWITTNATLIDEEKAEALATSGLARISVSIDGATPETYERIRKRGKFADVMRGLRALAAARQRHGRPVLYLSLVGMASNLGELPDLVTLCAEVGGDGVFVEGLYPYEHPVIEDFVRREHLGHLGVARVIELVEEARMRAAFLGVDFCTRLDEILAHVPPETPVEEAAAATPVVAVPAVAPLSEMRMPWACSEPFIALNVTASGEVRTCCFNDDELGNLNQQTMEEIWNGPGYTALRADMAAGRVPPGCEVCVRNSRVKQSPFLTPRAAEPVNPAPVVIDMPGEGELISGPLVIVGHAARGTLDRAQLPEAWVDGTQVAWLNDSALVDGDSFAAFLTIPFVSTGAHTVSFRPQGGTEQDAFGHRHIQVGALRGGLAGVSRLAIPVSLEKKEAKPILRLNGGPRPIERWICGRSGRDWLAVAMIDVSALAPGTYDLEMAFAHHPVYRDRLVRL
jgi:MoaA/NifB/PqqE/SkfB family radical SAM enzyme